MLEWPCGVAQSRRIGYSVAPLGLMCAGLAPRGCSIQAHRLYLELMCAGLALRGCSIQAHRLLNPGATASWWLPSGLCVLHWPYGLAQSRRIGFLIAHLNIMCVGLALRVFNPWIEQPRMYFLVARLEHMCAGLALQGNSIQAHRLLGGSLRAVAPSLQPRPRCPPPGPRRPFSVTPSSVPRRHPCSLDPVRFGLLPRPPSPVPARKPFLAPDH